MVLFPWRHKPWSRAQRQTPSTPGVNPGSGGSGFVGGNGNGSAIGNGYAYAPPREDVNSPDLYIPGGSLTFQKEDDELNFQIGIGFKMRFLDRGICSFDWT